MDGEVFELFFALPLELREDVLSYLVAAENTINLSTNDERVSGTLGRHSELTAEETHSQRSEPSVVWPWRKFLVNKQLHHEASSVFFRKNAFSLDCRVFAFKALRDDDPLITNRSRWSQSKPPRWGLRKQLQSLILHIELENDFVATDHFKRSWMEVLDMVRYGSLNNLEVRINKGVDVDEDAPLLLPPSCSPLPLRKGAFSTEDVSSSPCNFWDECTLPLLQLLSEPRLRRAKILAPSIYHPGSWCAYHEHTKEELCSRSDLVHNSQVPMRMYSNANGAHLEIDIKSMLEDAQERKDGGN